MTYHWHQPMKNAISEVLETMFFVLIDFVTQLPDDVAYPCASRIRIHEGSREEWISFRVSESFARMLTANFLGKREVEVTREEMEDVMKELANMTGGNYVSRKQGENWQLGIPRSEDVKYGAEVPASALLLENLGESVGWVNLESDV